MAAPAVGVSLGQSAFKIQDTFRWEDLSLGSGPAARQARHIWEVSNIPQGAEAHFFEARMNAFKERGKFTLVISVLLLPYDTLLYSDTSNLRAEKAMDLAAMAMTYLGGLLGSPLVKRVTRRYGGRILEWLESVSALDCPEVGNETH